MDNEFYFQMENYFQKIIRIKKINSKTVIFHVQICNYSSEILSEYKTTISLSSLEDIDKNNQFLVVKVKKKFLFFVIRKTLYF